MQSENILDANDDFFSSCGCFCPNVSLLVLCIDRYKILRHNSNKIIPMHVVLPLVWVMSMSMVLPYTAYISHFYLDDLGPGFTGGEFCVVNLTGNVAAYMRALFFLL